MILLQQTLDVCAWLVDLAIYYEITAEHIENEAEILSMKAFNDL